MDKLEGLYTKGKTYVYGKEKTPYIGYYNVNLTNSVVYTGTKRDKNSKILRPLNQKKPFSAGRTGITTTRGGY